MNTDKIYAEHLANEYAPKDDSKVIALRKLDAKAKLPATVFYLYHWYSLRTDSRSWYVPVHESDRKRQFSFVCTWCHYWAYGLAAWHQLSRLQENAGERKKKYAFEIMELAKEISGE